MRTKPVEGVLRLETNVEPKPSAYLVYDGLAGISERKKIMDMIDFLDNEDVTLAKRKAFLKAVEKSGSAEVQVYFQDYVSYGVGGGEATSEFLFGTFRLYHVSPARPFRGWKGPGLALARLERIPSEPSGEPYEACELTA
jgi:hypothetical protein